MKRNKYVLALCGAAAGLSMAIAGTGVAAAATTSHQTAFSRTAGAATAKVPSSVITGAGAKALYKPASVSMKWSGPAPAKTCTKANEGLILTNKTSVTQTVTLAGKPFASLKAGRQTGICAWGSGTTTAKLGLKSDKKAFLTLHVS